jgi:hypothetical protein
MNPRTSPKYKITMEALQVKFPDIHPITPFVYKVDTCVHGKACKFYASFFSGDLVRVSCNWCAAELGYDNPTTIHSELCQDYVCMCDLEADSVYTFLYNTLGVKLPPDVVHYIVPMYIDLHKCDGCAIPSLHLRKCIHCKTDVCKECIVEQCDKCNDILCKKCIEFERNHYSQLIHGLECTTCFYKICTSCQSGFNTCGWCLKYMCLETTTHTCQAKYEIVNSREYYWLQNYTRFDELFQFACNWYHEKSRYYETDCLYDVIKIEALEDFIEQGGCVWDIPLSMRDLV